MKMIERLGLHIRVSGRSAAAIVGIMVGIIDEGSDSCVFRGDWRRFDSSGRQGNRRSSSLSTFFVFFVNNTTTIIIIIIIFIVKIVIET